MNPEPPTPDTASSPGDDWQQAWATWRRRMPREALVVGLLCLGISAILTATDGRGFGYKLVYSLCIGFACTLTVDVFRVATAIYQARQHRLRGLPPPDTSGHAIPWLGVLPGSLMAMLLGPPAGLWLGDQITGLRSPSVLDLGDAGSRITLVLSVLATLFSVAVLSTLERLNAARAKAEAAQRQAAESQLRLLQSQLEPHMLFNTLANLRALIGLDAARAQGMLDHLIAYLRATLNASRHSEHALATEFDRLADYLELMRVRMGSRLQVELDLPADLRSVPVPPLLLQPLVENAIQHGLEPHVQGGRVRVAARAEGPVLVLTVRDTGTGLAAVEATGPSSSGGTGFGLSQVRERLATLHGARAGLGLEPATDGEGGTLATVRLPLPSGDAR